MSLLQRNIVANLVGNGWSALIAFIAIPFYIKFMGIEAYGLVAIYTTILSLSFILDLGMSTTISREIARLKSNEGNEVQIRNLSHTLEIISWCIALFLGILIVILSYSITFYWIRPAALDYKTIHQTVILMGISLVFQWPFSFYSSGLIGLEKQVLLNVVTSIFMTIRNVGAIILLWKINHSIMAFFIWQIIVNLIQIVIIFYIFWRSLPFSPIKSTFQPFLLSSIWRFAAGMGGISVTGLIWAQIDKVILSRLLNLEMFGFYSLAWVVSSSLSRIVGPIVIAIFPRLTHLISIKDIDGLKQVYHSSCQLMSVLIIPIALFLSFFSSEILFLWTRNSAVADKAHQLVFLLSLSTLFNSFSHVPLSLEYAYGRTHLVFFAGIITILFMIPSIYLITIYFGPLGASVLITVINFSYTLIMTSIIHKSLLPEEFRCWYVNDVGFPFLASLSVILSGYCLLKGSSIDLALIFGMIITVLIAIIFAIMTTPLIRSQIFSCFIHLQRRFSYGS